MRSEAVRTPDGVSEKEGKKKRRESEAQKEISPQDSSKIDILTFSPGVLTTSQWCASMSSWAERANVSAKQFVDSGVLS